MPYSPTLATTTLLSTVTLPDMTSIAEIQYMEGAKKVEPKARQLFKYYPMAPGSGTEKLLQEFDTQTFALVKNEGQNVSKAQAGTGFSKLATLKRYGIEIDITYEERMFNKYPEVKAKLISLGEFVTQRLEIDLTHRFTFAGATSYTNMDGVSVDISTGETSATALVTTSHALAFSSTTYSNQVSGDPVFSETNLASAELLASTNVYSAYGEKRVMNFNKLVIADNPTTINLARQILQSDAQISAPNAAVENVYKAKYELVVLPYLATTATGAYNQSKKNYWFLVAAGQWNGYLVMWEEAHMISPAPGNNLEDAHADIWTYGTRGGYAIVGVTATGVIGSLNAS